MCRLRQDINTVSFQLAAPTCRARCPTGCQWDVLPVSDLAELVEEEDTPPLSCSLFPMRPIRWTVFPHWEHEILHGIQQNFPESCGNLNINLISSWLQSWQQLLCSKMCTVFSLNQLHRMVYHEQCTIFIDWNARTDRSCRIVNDALYYAEFFNRERTLPSKLLREPAVLQR